MSRFYHQKVPKEGELVEIKLISHDDTTGFTAKLIEYGDLEGLLPDGAAIHRLKRGRKITSMFKLGSTQLAVVERVDGTDVDLNLTSVNKHDQEQLTRYMQQTRDLITFCHRLADLADAEVSYGQWLSSLVWNNHSKEESLDDPDAHLYERLKMRQFDSLDLTCPDVTDTHLRELLTQYHLALFGAQVVTHTAQFTAISFKIDGAEHLSQAFRHCLATLSHEHTDQELYDDLTLFSLVIRPNSAPVYELVVRSGSQETAEHATRLFMSELADQIAKEGVVSLKTEP